MSNQFSSAPIGSQQRSKDLMAAAKKMLSGTSSAPKGTMSSGTSEYRAGTSGTPAGASGHGYYLDNPAYAQEQMELINSGAPMSAGSDFRTYVEPRLNKQQASGVAKTFGLDGMNLDSQLVGLTQSQARKKAQELGEQRQGQVSANTSFSFNPQTIAGFKKSLDDIQLKLNDINNDPFKAREEKQDDQKSTVNSYTDQLAGLFNNLQELNTAMQNPQFQQQVQTFEQQGGDMAQVAEKVQAPQSQFNMSIDEYLGDVDTTAQKQAYQSLFVEGKIAQDQIMMEQGITEQYREQYFGDAGVYHQMAEQQKEREKLIDKRMIQEAKNARAQADLQMQKMDAQAQNARATTEENRVNAKNYITGQLAKMGALKTTGQAPIAIANLDQKYQAQLTQIDTDFSLSKNQMEIQLNDYLRNLELDRDENILKTREDLTLDQSKMMETIMKAQIDADRRSFKIISDFAGDFRKETDKYQKELDKAAKKYTSDYTSIVSTYNLPNFKEFKSQFGIMKPDGTIAPPSMGGPNDFKTVNKTNLLPPFLQSIVGKGVLSTMTENILNRKKNIGDYSTSNQTKVRAELSRLGISPDDIGGISTTTQKTTKSNDGDLSDEDFLGELRAMRENQ